MKPESGSLELMHARVHARHGQRVDEATWRRIEVVREFGAALELARGTALRPWLVGITAETPCAPLEATLRGHWHALVREVQGWLPPAWAGAMAWCAVWPELPWLQHLARGGAPPAWMQADPRWAALAGAPPSATSLSDSAWAPLAPAWAEPAGLGRAWVAEWRRRCPARTVDASLTRLQTLLAEHGQAFAQAGAAQGWALRSTLRTRLGLLLRTAALGPAVAFVHVALCALDLERLRAELVRRALFPRWMI